MDQTTTNAAVASQPKNWLSYQGLRSAHERAYEAALNLGAARHHLMTLREMTNDVCTDDRVDEHLPAIEAMILDLVSGMSINSALVEYEFSTPWSVLNHQEKEERRYNELAEAEEVVRAARDGGLKLTRGGAAVRGESPSKSTRATENAISSHSGSPPQSAAG